MIDTMARERVGGVLGPVGIAGTSVRLRPPMYGDFVRWQALRLRDRALVEPFWSTSALSWEQRHTEQAWVREVLDHRLAARRGDAAAWVIEADGQLVGQLNLTEIDLRRGSAEAGIWVESGVARQGVAGLAMSMLLDEAFTRLGLTRVVAPVAATNVGTQRGALAVGMRHEADLKAYFDAGGARRDHALFAVVVEDTPAGGFVAAWLARRGEPSAAAAGATPYVGRRALPSSWRGRAEIVRHSVRPPVRLPVRLPRQRTAADLAVGGLRLLADPSGETWQVVQDQRVVGRVGLRHVRASLGRAEVWWEGYGAASGLIGDAVGVVIGHALDGRGLGRVEAVVVGDDDRAVATGAGLSLEGRLRGYRCEHDLVRRDVDLWAAARA